MDLEELHKPYELSSWSSSYELRVMRQGTAPVTYWYVAGCKLCTHVTKLLEGAEKAHTAHIFHCARMHGYVFSEDYHLSVEDKQLQETIQLSQIHDFPPIPGYEDHSRCIKKMRDGIVVCGIHTGNEYVPKINMAWI